jgi:hypothetical protein
MDEATLSKWREKAQEKLSEALVALFQEEIPTIIVWDTLDLATRIHKKGLIDLATKEGGGGQMVQLINELETCNETTSVVEGRNYISKKMKEDFGEPT